ncbi:hypothetical protein CLOP_g19482 [Closterium sp. NIES-67]|nr:hypothetical protein CLOP_g19482 [Closterium sp. NIES-67]
MMAAGLSSSALLSHTRHPSSTQSSASSASAASCAPVHLRHGVSSVIAPAPTSSFFRLPASFRLSSARLLALLALAGCCLALLALSALLAGSAFRPPAPQPRAGENANGEAAGFGEDLKDGRGAGEGEGMRGGVGGWKNISNGGALRTVLGGADLGRSAEGAEAAGGGGGGGGCEGGCAGTCNLAVKQCWCPHAWRGPHCDRPALPLCTPLSPPTSPSPLPLQPSPSPSRPPPSCSSRALTCSCARQCLALGLPTAPLCYQEGQGGGEQGEAGGEGGRGGEERAVNASAAWERVYSGQVFAIAGGGEVEGRGEGEEVGEVPQIGPDGWGAGGAEGGRPEPREQTEAFRVVEIGGEEWEESERVRWRPLPPWECSRNCSGRGTCHVGNTCSCPPAFSGRWCEWPAHLIGNLTGLCYNNCSGAAHRGRCVEGVCVCEQGAFGADCSLEINAEGRVSLAQSEPSTRKEEDQKRQEGQQGGTQEEGESQGSNVSGGVRPRMYIYELPPVFHQWLIHHTAPSAFHRPEPLLFLERLLASPYRTANGSEADFYFVPLLLHAYGDRALAYLQRAIAYIRATWPFWDERGGSGKGHILFAMAPLGACHFAPSHPSSSSSPPLTPPGMRPPLLRDAITLTPFTLPRNLFAGRAHPCFIPLQDIAVPPMPPLPLLRAALRRLLAFSAANLADGAESNRAEGPGRHSGEGEGRRDVRRVEEEEGGRGVEGEGDGGGVDEGRVCEGCLVPFDPGFGVLASLKRLIAASHTAAAGNNTTGAAACNHSTNSTSNSTDHPPHTDPFAPSSHPPWLHLPPTAPLGPDDPLEAHHLQHSRFCLAPLLAHGWSPAALHALLLGCIPLLLHNLSSHSSHSSHSSPPLHPHPLHWPRFSLHDPLSHLSSLPRTLRSLPRARVQALQAEGFKAAVRLLYESPSFDPWEGVLPSMLSQQPCHVSNGTSREGGDCGNGGTVNGGQGDGQYLNVSLPGEWLVEAERRLRRATRRLGVFESVMGVLRGRVVRAQQEAQGGGERGRKNLMGSGKETAREEGGDDGAWQAGLDGDEVEEEAAAVLREAGLEAEEEGSAVEAGGLGEEEGGCGEERSALIAGGGEDSGSMEGSTGRGSTSESTVVSDTGSGMDVADGDRRGGVGSAGSKGRRCSEGCRFTCNQELGRCDCPPDWEGPACDTPSMPACRLPPLSLLQPCALPTTCRCALDCNRLAFHHAFHCLPEIHPNGTLKRSPTEIFEDGQRAALKDYFMLPEEAARVEQERGYKEVLAFLAPGDASGVWADVAAPTRCKHGCSGRGVCHGNGSHCDYGRWQ